MLAYVLITTKSGYENQIATSLLEFSQVDNIHVLFGEFDIICRIKTNSEIELRKFILNKLRKIEGVEFTKTLIVAD
ncbi:MAG: Lrp/AsnC ligand binding domain-containing protein [Nanoarchaeota archaeon]|nr:Lrp/AsnC ligand binding domain-containing protein [Nanoarchaeota archaeon]